MDTLYLKQSLSELSNQLDDLGAIEKRHSIVESLPTTNDSKLVELYIKNLSSDVENGQWTLDESIFSVINTCDPEAVIEAVFSLLPYFTTNHTVEHMVIILSSLCKKYSVKIREYINEKSEHDREALGLLLEGYPDLKALLLSYSNS